MKQERHTHRRVTSAQQGRPTTPHNASSHLTVHPLQSTHVASTKQRPTHSLSDCRSIVFCSLFSHFHLLHRPRNNIRGLNIHHNACTPCTPTMRAYTSALGFATWCPQFRGGRMPPPYQAVASPKLTKFGTW